MEGQQVPLNSNKSGPDDSLSSSCPLSSVYLEWGVNSTARGGAVAGVAKSVWSGSPSPAAVLSLTYCNRLLLGHQRQKWLGRKQA